MTFSYALLAGILPAVLWLLFWLREDNLHPEPKLLLIGSFLSGMFVVVVAALLEKYAADIFFDTNTRYIVWAAIEEILKFLAVAVIALNSKNMDEPIDAMIYCITVALGFAALENAFFIFSPLNNGDLTGSIINGNMRFIGATLVHIVCSASIGFMIGITYYKNSLVKTVAIIVGVILATTLHASFNLSIINETVTNTLRTFGWVWIAVIILLVLFEEIKDIKPNSKIQNS